MIARRPRTFLSWYALNRRHAWSTHIFVVRFFAPSSLWCARFPMWVCCGACLFSLAAFLGKARPFADASTYLYARLLLHACFLSPRFSGKLDLLPTQAPVVMFCPWKKSCAVGRIGLYTFLRFASSPRLLCPTRILNEMNIKCRMALGASDQQLNIRTQRRLKLTKTGKSAIRSQTMENSHISAKK